MFFTDKSDIVMITVPSLSVYMAYHIYPSIATLSGQLKPLGYNVKCYDFDIELVNDFFDKKVIKKVFNSIKNPPESIIKKYSLYLKYYNKYNKDNNSFDYDEKLFLQNKIFTLALAICNYTPSPLKNNNYENLKSFSFDEKNNFLVNYFKNKLKLIKGSPKVVCIASVPSNEFYPTMTLAYLAKKIFGKSKIILGGNWVSSVSDEIVKHKDFFDLYCDYILKGDGEESVVQLVRYILGQEKDINKVPNLIYKNDSNEICTTFENLNVDITKILPANYDDYQFNKYFSEKKIISAFLTKGCYWGKCRFCNYINNKRFQLKPVNQVIDEIKFYIDRYKINQIFFVDDAIPPAYYNTLANALIENNIKIDFSSFVIMDSGFTSEVLNNLRKAGLQLLQWGFETNSKRLFDLINKSGSFDNRGNILRYSHEEGITNIVDIIDGLPTETLQDVIDTVSFLNENIEYIDMISIQKFQMRKNSEFCNNAHLYNIEITDKQEFSLQYSYKKTDEVSENYKSLYSYYLDVSQRKEYICNSNGREVLRTMIQEFLRDYSPHLLK